MKNMKRFLALLIAMMMVLAMGVAAFADDGPTVEPPADAPANGTITLNNALNGYIYSLYKLFDISYGGIGADGKPIYAAYTTQADVKTALAKDDSPFVITTTQGNMSFLQLKDGVSNDTTMAWIQNNWALFKDNLAGKKTATGGTVEFGVLPYGYYLLASQEKADAMPRAKFTVNINAPYITLSDKNDRTPGDVVKTADDYLVEVGQTVNYTVSFKATDYFTTLGQTRVVKEYVLTDTPVSVELPDAKTNITVKLYSEKKADGTFDPAKEIKGKTVEYTYAVDELGVATFTFPWATKVIDKAADKEKGTAEESHYEPKYDLTSCYVVVTYPAQVTDEMLYDADGKKNKVLHASNKIEMTYKIIPKTDSEDTEHDGGDDEVDHYSVGVSIRKIGIGGSEDTLTGAKFKLFKYDPKDSTKKLWYYYNSVDDKVEWLPSDSAKGADGDDKCDQATEAEADNLTSTWEFGGLDAGTYYLKETATPAGYTPPAAGTYFKVGFTGKEGDDGKPVFENLVNLTINQGSQVLTTVIQNTKGGSLPVTGGIGTTIFYIAGSILLVGALVMMITKKRMDAND